MVISVTVVSIVVAVAVARRSVVVTAVAVAWRSVIVATVPIVGRAVIEIVVAGRAVAVTVPISAVVVAIVPTLLLVFFVGFGRRVTVRQQPRNRLCFRSPLISLFLSFLISFAFAAVITFAFFLGTLPRCAWSAPTRISGSLVASVGAFCHFFLLRTFRVAITNPSIGTSPGTGTNAGIIGSIDFLFPRTLLHLFALLSVAALWPLVCIFVLFPAPSLYFAG
mmetsp:Transcript_1090/g.2199  ORF Transcript_1090/g.2199 Transcript_1090/m.2199 type:complete len:222 (+) Transcript_1090:995-1660(+)